MHRRHVCVPCPLRIVPALAAEESGAGKQILLDRGAYKDMDVCMMYVAGRLPPPPVPFLCALGPRLSSACDRCHPVAGDTLELGFVSSLALQSLSVEYFGQP